MPSHRLNNYSIVDRKKLKVSIWFGGDRGFPPQDLKIPKPTSANTLFDHHDSVNRRETSAPIGTMKISIITTRMMKTEKRLRFRPTITAQILTIQ